MTRGDRLKGSRRKEDNVLGGAPSKPLVLVVGADDRYAMPLAVTLYSALIHLPGEIPVRIHVFDGGISDKNRRRVERVVRDACPTTELKWHVLDHKRLEGLRVTRWMTTAAYLRLLIPEILVEVEEIVIYLDSDLLVRHDLSPLLREAGRSPESAILAVDDFRYTDLGEVLGDQSCLDLAVDPRAPFFNSGVLVIDVKKWRDMQAAERAFAFVREHASIMRHHDQDALNVVFARQWHRLDPRWNVMLPELRRYIARERGGEPDHERRMRDLATGAFIFHFIGPQKPWKARYEGSARHEYHHALWNSGWFEGDRELSFWRAKLAISTIFWRAYRSLPEGTRAKVRSASRQTEGSDRRTRTSPSK